MYNVCQVDPPGDDKSHTRNNTDGEQIPSKYYEKVVKELCRATQNHAYSFNIQWTEKVHSDEKLL